ncbi:hypothetical protein [Anaeroselena agilis]|uniref:Uncharacterized protein n=1 Tax=Anaeroselena agilis TaxID=3063788 RepID=A0ABU3P328_9FIRM|nr:hypothetical protein [Selenomonadales bacterium 4137-cl]
MEEAIVIATDPVTEASAPQAGTDAFAAADGGEAAESGAARLPDISSWLPGGSIWLYAIPLVLLLFLWLFYPAILILACIILFLWLLS